MKRITKETRLTIQLGIAMFLVLVGVGLLVAGFIIAPTGEIHNSVLVAFGECCTFAGALIGVDYHYKYNKLLDDVRDKANDINEERSEDYGDNQEG